MSFKEIASRYPRDKDTPARAHTQILRRKLLDGTFYNILPYDFSQERAPGDRPIPLADRKPNVKVGTNIIRSTVEDSTFMLFGEGQFPSITTASDTARTILSDLVEETDLSGVLREAAFWGSTGSAAVRIHVSKNGNIHYKYFDTTYLTPTWDPDEPNQLLQVEHREKFRGADLKAAGYVIPKENLRSIYVFLRIWDRTGEIWFIPWLASEDTEAKPHIPQVDESRTVRHNLGFVPMVWIKNLHGGDEIDGGCQWNQVTDDCITVDYLMSQLSRGLKYSQDPLLLIKEPPVEAIMNPSSGLEEVTDMNGNMGLLKTPSSMLTVNSESGGDAKFLEINGSAADAVLTYVSKTTTWIKEAIHGNRLDPEKISAGPRGSKALEMMNNGLVMLTAQLRDSYGDKAMVGLLKMFLKIVAQRPNFVRVKGQIVPAELANVDDLKLRWPEWYPPTPSDLQTSASALKVLIDSEVMSRETAVRVIAKNYDISDVDAELAIIKAEQAAEDARVLAVAAQQQKSTALVTARIDD